MRLCTVLRSLESNEIKRTGKNLCLQMYPLKCSVERHQESRLLEGGDKPRDEKIQKKQAFSSSIYTLFFNSTGRLWASRTMCIVPLFCLFFISTLLSSFIGRKKSFISLSWDRIPTKRIPWRTLTEIDIKWLESNFTFVQVMLLQSSHFKISLSPHPHPLSIYICLNSSNEPAKDYFFSQNEFKFKDDSERMTRQYQVRPYNYHSADKYDVM